MFHQTMHELFLDLGVFGTAVGLQEWDDELQLPVFRAYPLAHCYVQENDKGEIDTVSDFVNWLEGLIS